MESIREDYRVRRFRERIKIKEIAEMLGCTKALISNWENGRGYMSKEKVQIYMQYIDNKVKEGEV